MEAEGLITISEAGEKLGVSAKTLRRLCNLGLVPGVRRDYRRRRVFSDGQVDHMRTLLGLRRAGFSNRELRSFVWMCRQGRGTLPKRKATLETQKRQLWKELQARQEGIDFLERQIELIDKALAKYPADTKK